MTATIATTYETLVLLGDCVLVLDRSHKEIQLRWAGHKSCHYDARVASAVAQGLLAALRARCPGPIVTIPRGGSTGPSAGLEYVTRIWLRQDQAVCIQTQGPFSGPLYCFDFYETLSLAQGLISGVRALSGWRLS